MPAPSPAVSIIVPTRDRPRWLARTLLSALAQRTVDCEIIVVDDGSRTPVAELLAPSAARQLTVLRNERSEGVAAARNRGIRAAAAPWVAFLDDDDVWAPAKLERQLDEAADADYAFTNGVTIDESGQVLSHDQIPEPDTDLHAAMLAANRVPCGCSNVIARTSVAKSVGGFDSDFSALADWDFHIRLSAAGRGAAIRDALVAYTLHSGNMHRDEALLAADLRSLERKHALARAALGVGGIDYRWWLSWRAGAQRAAGELRGAARSYWLLGRRDRDLGALLRALALRAGGEGVLASARRIRSLATQRAAVPEVPPQWLPDAANPPPQALRSVYRIEDAAPKGPRAELGLD